MIKTWTLRLLSIMPKFPGNFGPNVNGTVRPRWKSSGQSGLLWPVGPVQPKTAVPVPLQLVTTPSSQNGGWFRYKCLLVNMFKLQKKDVNFLLINSCTQGSGTAVHLNFFSFWFSSVFKDKYGKNPHKQNTCVGGSGWFCFYISDDFCKISLKMFLRCS